MVRLRLKRFGRTHKPFYRLNAIDQRSPRDGRSLEELGHFDPTLADESQQVNFKAERIQYWLSVGAQPSDRVQRFLAEIGIMEKPVFHDQPKKSKPKAKAVERMAANEQAKKAAAEATAAPAPEEAPVEETAADEAPAEEVVAEEVSTEEAAAEEAPAGEAAPEDGENGKAAE